MKKIAIFQTDLKMGGIQKSLINLLNNIDLNNIEIDLYLFEKEMFFKNSIPKNINIIYLKPQKTIYKFIPFKILKKIKKYEIKKTYDIVIDFNSYNPSVALAAINTLAKTHIMWIHNDVIRERNNNFKYRILHFFFKSKYIYFDTFVGVSKGVIEPFKKLNKIKNKIFHVIPNIVDTKEIFEKSKEQIDIKISEEKYNLVSVGRLCLQKGFDILINDINEVVKSRQDIHLYIIGDGEERKKLEFSVKEKELNEYITFLGAQPNPYKYMKKMDGFVLESRYEGQGIVILEAKALGLDLIIPTHLKEYIEDVPFSNNIINSLINTKKKTNKELDTLERYNNNIKIKLYELFNK